MAGVLDVLFHDLAGQWMFAAPGKDWNVLLDAGVAIVEKRILGEALKLDPNFALGARLHARALQHVAEAIEGESSEHALPRGLESDRIDISCARACNALGASRDVAASVPGWLAFPGSFFPVARLSSPESRRRGRWPMARVHAHPYDLGSSVDT